MTNITPVISSILIEAHSADPIPATYHSSKKLDAFLQEAYRIVFHPFTRFGRKIVDPFVRTPTFHPSSPIFARSANHTSPPRLLLAAVTQFHTIIPARHTSPTRSAQ